MVEKQFPSGTDVIRQGDEGDFFYVVESGTLDCLISREGDGGQPTKVTDYSAGGTFGELALMYGAPRAATVRATSNVVLWALDRVPFRKMLMNATHRQRRTYESFLAEIPLLLSLEPYERHKIADALDSRVFEDGEVVMRQGDTGDEFYLIESGEARVSKIDEHGIERIYPNLTRGKYFGELALLTNKPRQASIVAVGRLKCAVLNKRQFNRLLGPAKDIIKRDAANYAAMKALV
ncbi:camp-dependent protein kinase regulatory subunit, partial [Ramicandelaber brevisporus]